MPGLLGRPLPWRSLQVGLSGRAAHNYADQWIINIEDITKRVREIQQNIAAGLLDVARAKLPTERAYPLSHDIATTIGAR